MTINPLHSKRIVKRICKSRATQPERRKKREITRTDDTTTDRWEGNNARHRTENAKNQTTEGDWTTKIADTRDDRERKGERKGGREKERKAVASIWRTYNYDSIEKLANAAFRGRINATDRLSPIIKVLKQWELRALTWGCSRTRIYGRWYVHLSGRWPTLLRRCSSGRQPDVSLVSARLLARESRKARVP